MTRKRRRQIITIALLAAALALGLYLSLTQGEGVGALTAADVADAKDDARVCVQGKGACVSMMDNATVYAPALFRKALEIAEKNGIPAQVKTAVAGGNDAGSVHKSRAGVRTLTVSVPCRYIHSASCVCDKNDVLATRQLAEKVLEAFANADESDL